MQTQTQTQTQSDILQQFSDMLKNHSIVVADRDNLIKLLENIVDLCTQMPKTKLKAAVKAATKTPAVAKPAAKTPAAKKQPVRETLVGPADAGDCPVMSDLEAPARGRGRPRKTDATAVVTDNDAEKKKRGRPKKDKTVTISSNDDEDALIAKMIADVKKNAKQPAAAAKPAEEDDDNTESELDEFNGELIRAEETTPVVANSVSPVHQVEPIQPDVPIEVEADVANTKTKKQSKAKEPNAKETKAKETKAKEPKAKEPKAKETKAKEPKAKETKAKETKQSDQPTKSTADDVVPVPDTVAPAAVIQGSVSSATPLRENKASSDGNFYLMPNYPRQSFTYNGKTYLRTETDNVYDTMTLEMIGVWDHLNHEIITAFDDEEVEELWLSDEE